MTPLYEVSVIPSARARFRGPVVVLIGPLTADVVVNNIGATGDFGRTLR